MKKIRNLLLVLCIVALSACQSVSPITVETFGEGTVNAAQQIQSGTTNDIQATSIPLSTITVDYDQDDLETHLTTANQTLIVFSGDTIEIEGDGATASGSILTITSAGTYNISGILYDGQIIVDTQDAENVELILNGVEITCQSNAPLYISNAKKTVITLADGTENTITDGSSYVYDNSETDEPNAAIFSKDDLTINGNGALTVNANYNNGIVSKDDLKLVSGTITVNAVNDGIKGKDSIAVKDANITITAGADGMQAHNDTDPEKGYISIEGGSIHITSVLDAIQAETQLLISGGNITLVSGGGSINASTQGNWGNWGGRNPGNESVKTNSAKGLKAGVDITINAGTILIDSSDDAIHSNSSIHINGGEFTISSGDDGMHSDVSLEINGGTINILKSYEGIESAAITVNAGTINLTSSDDGFNTAGGVDGSAMNGRPGQNHFESFGNYPLYIHGGYITINADGDGLDANGSIEMTGGIVIINGPTNNGNGALDYQSTFNITGGVLVAVGSAGMAQAPSTSSTQYSVLLNFPSSLSAGSITHIETESGQEILTFMSLKPYQSIVFSTPDLQNGTTYKVYTGGSSNGTASDGLFTDGAYTAGTHYTDFTITSMVTGGSMHQPRRP